MRIMFFVLYDEDYELEIVFFWMYGLFDYVGRGEVGTRRVVAP